MSKSFIPILGSFLTIGAVTATIVYNSWFNIQRIRIPYNSYLDDIKKHRKNPNTININGIIDSKLLKYFKKKYNQLDSNQNLIIIIRSYGGSAQIPLKIIHLINQYPKQVICYIDQYAYSAAAIIALSCHMIYMTNDCHLGRIDKQITITQSNGSEETKSINQLKYEWKHKKYHHKDMVTDIFNDYQENHDILQIIQKNNGYSKDQIKSIKKIFIGGIKSHDEPICNKILKSLNLNIIFVSE